MVQTKKRKMSLKDFTRCNPGTIRSNTRKTINKCLPTAIYSDISKKLKIKDKIKKKCF